jgi:ketosteroid isomerase-like protein
MKRIAYFALCATIGALSAGLAWAGSPDPTVEQLTQLNATLQIATKNYDTAELAKLITDDYELVSSSGKVYDRQAFMADAGDRSATYEINEPEDVSVRHYNGDCAIVTAVLHVRYRASGKIHDVRIRYGDVWVKLNGRWRYAYGEASPLKSPKPA